jgi:hypothetical protein
VDIVRRARGRIAGDELVLGPEPPFKSVTCWLPSAAPVSYLWLLLGGCLVFITLALSDAHTQTWVSSSLQ